PIRPDKAMSVVKKFFTTAVGNLSNERGPIPTRLALPRIDFGFVPILLHRQTEPGNESDRRRGLISKRNEPVPRLRALFCAHVLASVIGDLGCVDGMAPFQLGPSGFAVGTPRPRS